jgi:hypothetical protein
MSVAIFWDIGPRNPFVNRLFGGTYHLRLQASNLLHFGFVPGWFSTQNMEVNQLRLQVRNLLHAGFLPGWFSTQNMEVICSSETSAHILTSRLDIPEDSDIQPRNQSVGSVYFLLDRKAAKGTPTNSFPFRCVFGTTEFKQISGCLLVS